MNWITTAAEYKNKLQATLDVQRHAKELLKIKAVQVPSDLKDNLKKDTGLIEKQHQRLEKNEFRIAVVGLEKAGKSTFVNAWLESSLLPAASERCTFTTTQIYSVTDPAKQRLEVEPKTPEEFNAYVQNLRAQAADDGETAKNAKEDLLAIDENRSTLDEVVREGRKTLSIARLDDSMEDLKKYVADVAFAHAIREVRLYTSNLAEADGVVFFDVPGLDSGLGKHLEESRNMLADCDAVICIQNSGQPSLVAHQKKLVEFVIEGDTHVGVAGKLFVFAGKVDQQGSTASLENNLKKISLQWASCGQLIEDHIIPGSAAAYLLLKGLGDDNLKEAVGSSGKMRNTLTELHGLGEDATEEQVIYTTGIPRIKKRITRYLNEERAEVLKKRCDLPIRTILEAARNIYGEVSKKFSENPDDVRKKEACHRNICFNEWWAEKWTEIEADINRFFENHFKERGPGQEVTSIQRMREKYENLVRQGLASLPSTEEQKRQNLFDRESRSGFDAKITNARWREQIYDRDIHTFIDNLSDSISNDLIQDCEVFVEEMTRQLWGAKDVQNYMINDHLKLRLESGFRSLFLRFSRPVAEALIRGPLGSDRRKEIIRHLGMDIELLDNYIGDEEPAFERLKRYAKYGRDLLDNPYVRQTILKITPPVALAAKVIAKTEKKLNPEPREAATLEEVIQEVDGDLVALEKYLIEAVFTAAGFTQYFIQELKRLLDKFVTMKSTWAGVAYNEYEAENPELMKALPEELKKTMFDVEISERLKQLRLSLENAREKGI